MIYYKTALATCIFLTFLSFLSCRQGEKKEVADMVISGGSIYTMDEKNPQVEAVAVKDGRILFAGSEEEARAYISQETTLIDLQGKTMTPGFIESHGHMMGLGYSQLNLDLTKIRNYDEMVQLVAEAVEKTEPGLWILGRGWHQSKWDTVPVPLVKGFQTHEKLSAISPDNPVYLRHASGHAGFANAKAMEIAGVNQLSIEGFTEDMEGGEIIRDGKGNPTGIFSERAQGIIARHLPESDPEKDKQALELAIKACQRNGITSFHDAGVGTKTMNLYASFKDQGKLGVRMYVMISGPDRELVKEWYARGPMVDTADHLFTVRSIKLNCDGALGNRGAWLLEEYSDMPGEFGMVTLPMDYVLETSVKALEHGFQVCSHAIGDRANREVLDRYQQALEDHPSVTDHRFRIEHAQHIHPDDIPRFGQMGVIAAMQAIHMSSDRPWAIDRLGEQRIKESAYVWQKLLKSGAVIINGTDVPVEPIDPIASFYASVTRKTLKETPEGGYEPDQKMSRAEALRSYTLDAAFGEFAEHVKGSIEPGKLADFTVFTQNLMTVPDDQILDTEVAMTIFNGEIVYEKAN